MMHKLSVRHLLGIKDLPKEDIELIFSTADNFKEVINRPIKKVPFLKIQHAPGFLLNLQNGDFRPML